MDLDTSRTPVGIDLAKDSIAVAVGDGDTEVVRAFPLSRDGLADLIRFLEPYGPFPEAFVFGLEASGPYTEPLLSWLLQRNGRVLQLNSLLITRFRRAQSLRRTKTDAIDARTILHFIAQLPPATVQPCELRDDLQALAAEYEQITQQVARLKTQVRQQVHALFPELAGSSSLFSQRILGLLLAFPSAHAIAKATPAQLEAPSQICLPEDDLGLRLSLFTIRPAPPSVSPPASERPCCKARSVNSSTWFRKAASSEMP